MPCDMRLRGSVAGLAADTDLGHLRVETTALGGAGPAVRRVALDTGVVPDAENMLGLFFRAEERGATRNPSLLVDHPDER